MRELYANLVTGFILMITWLALDFLMAALGWPTHHAYYIGVFCAAATGACIGRRDGFLP